MNAIKEHLANYLVHHVIITLPVALNVVSVVCTGKLIPELF